ncbi:2OG-Fe(II) oxygenase [Novosphingobium nitrogenifigens DSM 19370]|uniref:2OG-Fe(II) oxygenase n=1 Tax=Novosphingobium nitrogenifigens DSM 19370 TaxID=983920 RepID=F1Z8Q7_9SPHN|nr:2OG-Fe(II) oxygenase [Novosphingobium nitrogenifigens]EGD58968.1 2OG-Fe(II) oxygenase [Novosphingobium nitrogenifigens DSM 19370]
MVFSFRSSSRDEDRDALRIIGETVRNRLSANPAAYRLPVDEIEIYAVSEFLDTADCRRLIAMVDDVARPSPTYDDNHDKGRTSYTGDVDPKNPFIRTLQKRIDDLLGLDPALGETMQGQRYAVGQEFRHHFDYFVTKHDYWETERARGGQRSWTAMGYLNTVEEGGATDFSKANLTVPPEAGVLLIWNNMLPDGRPNPKTLHAGTPVLRGTKYVLTKWYRARPWA